jgi:hypothetical protein
MPLVGAWMSIPLAASLGEVLSTVVGIVLALAGLSTALLCLFAIADGERRRGVLGVVVGLGLVALGLWLTGALA